jgi:hypothetical protein
LLSFGDFPLGFRGNTKPNRELAKPRLVAAMVFNSVMANPVPILWRVEIFSTLIAKTA